MGIKMNELVNLRPMLEKIATAEMYPKAALAYAGFIRGIFEALQNLEVHRASLFRKYGKEQEDGGYRILPENEEAFQTEIQKALDREIEVERFPIAVLEEIKLTPAELVNALILFK